MINLGKAPEGELFLVIDISNYDIVLDDLGFVTAFTKAYKHIPARLKDKFLLIMDILEVPVMIQDSFCDYHPSDTQKGIS